MQVENMTFFGKTSAIGAKGCSVASGLWYFHGVFGRKVFHSVSFSCLKPSVTSSFKG